MLRFWVEVECGFGGFAVKLDDGLIGRFRDHLKNLGRQDATIECYARDGEDFLKFVDDAGVQLVTWDQNHE